jgi:hypothetical protein
VIICDFDFVGIVFPPEADTILIVHADGPLSGAIPAQEVEPVPRRHSQLVHMRNAVKLLELAMCSALDLLREPPRRFASEDTLGFGICESAYHQQYIITLRY